MDNSPIYHNDILGDDTDKDPKPKSKKSVNNKSKPKKSAHKEEDWRNKYFGPVLELQTNASSWATEQSNKMTEAVHQVDAIMKPLKDEKIKELKVLYKIQAELGGSGMASGLPLNVTNKLKNSTKGTSVIGPKSNYREFAKKIGASYLNVTDEGWTMRKNVEFLQGVVKRGDDVIFSGKFNPARIDPKSVLAQEIRYLKRHGYTWTSDYSKLIKK